MPYVDFPQCDYARVLFWVGGTDTWDSAAGTKWDTDPEGSGGAPAPTENDIVIFTPYSSGTVTLDSAARCNSVFFFGWPGTLSHPSGVLWEISGSLSMCPEMTYTPGTSGADGILFNSTCEFPRYINFAGHQTRGIEFNGTGEWWLLDEIETTSGSMTITLTKGTLRTKDFDMTVGNFVISGTDTRALYLGSSDITLFGSTVLDGWNAGTTTNLTFDAGTSTIDANGHNFTGGGLDYYDVIMTSRQADRDFSGENTFNNLTVNGLASVDSDFKFYDDQIITGTLTFTGNSVVNKFIVQSDIYGTQRTITAANVVANNVHFQDIVGDGDASWNFSAQTNIGDAFGNTGITFPAPVNVYWVGNGGNWTTTTKWASGSGGSGGSGRYPLLQDTAVFDGSSITSGSQTVFINCRHVPNIDASAVTNDPAFRNFNGLIFYGDYISASATNFGETLGLGSCLFNGRGNHTISVGSNWINGCSPNFDVLGGSYTFDSDWLNSSDGTTGTMSLTSGIFDFNDNNIKMPRIFVFADATLSMGSGTITCSGTTTPWAISPACTINAETSTLSITNTGTLTFDGDGKTYSTVLIRSSANTCTINGSNTYTAALTAVAPAVLRFENGSTQTFSLANGFNMIGTAGNIINLNRVSSGVFTISSANNQTIDYCTLSNCTATGGGTFNATNSTDGGGNTGWTITP